MENGNYDLYLVTDSLEPLISNMTIFNRIVRSHVGNKLVTMTYDKNIVNMKVEDFSYQYDIVIDPGHGGAEYGAVNGRYYEKSINLEQSLYEKQRYEAHGLRVLILRDTDDNYGIVMGEEGMGPVDRKAFAVGYYGAVSKVIYSNHHNSSGNTSSRGWEILVPAQATYEDLKVQHTIADAWSNMYIKQTNPYYRFYTKDYETGTANNKLNGEIYNFEDYYSVIRIPNKLFNVQNVLYEGAYINNNSDMYWYYTMENWKQLSEIKIKAYVESKVEDGIDRSQIMAIKMYGKEHQTMIAIEEMAELINSDKWNGEDVMAIFFNEFNRYIQSRGATMLIAGYPIARGKFSPPAEDYVKFQNELAEKLDCEIISDYRDYFYPYEYFYDTTLHLKDYAADIRTSQLIKDLKNWQTRHK